MIAREVAFAAVFLALLLLLTCIGDERNPLMVEAKAPASCPNLLVEHPCARAKCDTLQAEIA